VTPRYDVLVVGAGPAGASAAFWLASAGRRVLVVDKKQFPREKTCGDGLTPRAVRELHDMGLRDRLSDFQRYDGLRAIAHDITLELTWPDHPRFPPHGYVVRRRDLDQMVADQAAKAGADVWMTSEAVAPLTDDGVVRGALVRRDGTTTERVQARYLVVADGANSRFGRALGTARRRSYPLGMAIRGYFTSPHHDDPWIESHLDLRDRDGNHLPGYGWVFPVGDGTVNVGQPPHGRVRRHRTAAVGHQARDVVRPAHWRQAADRRVGRARRRADLARSGRRGRVHQPLQR
jgi:geranylgeranyl reductase family protein